MNANESINGGVGWFESEDVSVNLETKLLRQRDRDLPECVK